VVEELALANDYGTPVVEELALASVSKPLTPALEPADHNLSMIVTLAWPPPSHIVCRP